MIRKIVAVLIIVFAVLMGYGLYQLWFVDDEAPEVEATNPTNFADSGTVVMDDGTPQFIYTDAGGTEFTANLALDSYSVCQRVGGALPCLVMAPTFEAAFGGAQVTVEGETQGDGSILVRKIAALPEGVPARLGEPGERFVTWPHAIEQLEACNVSLAVQTHALDVYLTLKDGTRVRAVEPNIDEVFRVLDEVRGECGTIPVATE